MVTPTRNPDSCEPARPAGVPASLTTKGFSGQGEHPARSSRGSRTRRGQWGWKGLTVWLVSFAILVLVPAVVIDTLLDDVRTSLERVIQETQEEQAQSLLGSFEQALDRTGIFQDFLAAFQRRCRVPRLDAERTHRLQRLVTGPLRFPSGTELVWFDRRGRLVVPRGEAMPRGGRRFWEDLLKALLVPDRVEDSVRARAMKLLRMRYGAYMTLPYFRESTRRPVKVVQDALNRMVRLVRLRENGDQGRVTGYLLFDFPYEHVRPDWELRRAVFGLARQGKCLGAVRRGEAQIIRSPDMSPNLVHGLAQRLETASSSYQDVLTGRLLVARFWTRDPEVLLVVGSDPVGTPMRRGIAAIGWARSFLALGTIALLGGFLLLGTGNLRWDIGFAGKFLLAMGLVVGLPLGAMIAIGLERSIALARSERSALERVLNGVLEELERAVADGMVETERRLKSLFQNPAVRFPTDFAVLNELFRPIHPLGLIRAVGYPADRFSGGRIWVDEIEGRLTLQTSSFLFQLFGGVMRRLGFPYDPHLLPATKKSEVELILDSVRLDRETLEQTVGRFDVFSIGNTVWYQFRNIVRMPDGTPNAMYDLGFDIRRFQGWFLGKALQRRRQDWRGIAVIRPLRTTYPERRTQLGSLLRRAEFLQAGQRAEFLWKGIRWVGFARPLAGLDFIAAVALPQSELFPTTRRFSWLLALFCGLAVLVAGGLTRSLRRSFLTPILELAQAVQEVERGEYHPTLPAIHRDELGTLRERFLQMVRGLLEKTRMRSLLQADLVDTAGREAVRGHMRRQSAVVCFAGLRSFSALERDLEAEESMRVMSRFLGMCEASLVRFGGRIDKFIGDTAMGFFVDEDGTEPPAERAVRAGLDLQAQFDSWMAERRLGGEPLLTCGIGLAQGEVLAGSIGSRRKRLDFTVIGDTVNVAARLEKLAGSGSFPSLLVSETGWTSTPPGVERLPVEISQVRGKKSLIRVFTVRQPACPANPEGRPA